MSRTVNKLPLLGHPQIELRGIWNFSLVTLKKSVILGLSSFQFMAMARRGLFYTFLALYLRVVLGLSVTATTLLASLSMIANSASQTFIWGKISDKYQARTILVVIGEIIAAFGYVFVYFLHINLLNTSGSIRRRIAL